MYSDQGYSSLDKDLVMSLLLCDIVNSLSEVYTKACEEQACRIVAHNYVECHQYFLAY